MEDLNLTETEMRYFGDLFLCCDEESNGKIPILKATELFRSSNVPNEVLKQIMDISVAPNNCASMNHLNRKQFYSALKLIAAHQTNMSLKPELLSTPVDLPLPRFTWTINSEATADLIQLSNSPKEQYMSKRDGNFVSSIGAYEPMRLSSNLSDSDVPQTLSHDTTEGLSTDSEKESETMSQRSSSRGHRGKNGSPWSTASESPTPTNSVAERVHPVWEHSATGRGVWPANTTEEHTQLLGTEEESSDRHSSEEEGEGEDMWAISAAQAAHYAAQFAQLRPDRGLLPGHTARLFFEKSRLSVPDLRKIWQLADITKDGMLTLDEFSIAMHLIVLRRNSVPVPEVLPAALVPPTASGAGSGAGTDLVDLGADMLGSGTSADFDFADAAGDRSDRADLTPPKLDPPPSKQWTKFVDSPTSSLASPGPKPVNFDFQRAAVERDPTIYHPVALRVTPDAHLEGRTSASPRRDDLDRASPKRDNGVPPAPAPAPAAGTVPVTDIKPIQRPQPRKPLKNAGVLPPPPAREPLSLGGGAGGGGCEEVPAPRKEPPPPPPPRPLRNHARSSSLDLTRLAPAPPPRASPAPASPPMGARRPLPAQRSEGEYDAEGIGAAPPIRSHTAFEVVTRGGGAGGGAATDARALLDQNAVLHRVCRALQAELADVMRERDALRHKLHAICETDAL